MRCGFIRDARSARSATPLRPSHHPAGLQVRAPVSAPARTCAVDDQMEK